MVNQHITSLQDGITEIEQACTQGGGVTAASPPPQINI
jgi:hypothetical protein